MELAEHQKLLLRDFIEENWSDFLDHVEKNYDSREEAEEEAEDICNTLNAG